VVRSVLRARNVKSGGQRLHLSEVRCDTPPSVTRCRPGARLISFASSPKRIYVSDEYSEPRHHQYILELSGQPSLHVVYACNFRRKHCLISSRSVFYFTALTADPIYNLELPIHRSQPNPAIRAPLDVTVLHQLRSRSVNRSDCRRFRTHLTYRLLKSDARCCAEPLFARKRSPTDR
jgi:hypothetical protein